MTTTTPRLTPWDTLQATIAPVGAGGGGYVPNDPSTWYGAADTAADTARFRLRALTEYLCETEGPDAWQTRVACDAARAAEGR